MTEEDKFGPGQLTIKGYTFNLQKYKSAAQKQAVSKEIERCLYKLISSNETDVNIVTNEQLSLIYGHLTEHNSWEWKIYFKESFGTIYKFIPTIYFGQTSVINISQCQITNIEALAYLRAPALYTLELYSNHFTSIKPLVKNNQLQQLRNLTLSRNLIVDLWMLQRSKLDCMFYLELDIDSTDNVFCQDITFIYKIPIMHKGQQVVIWYDRASRIIQPIENYFKKFNDIKRN